MSLRTKFAVLLGLLGMAVLASLAAAWWSVETAQREVRDPVHSMSGALSGLGHCKRALEDAGTALNPDAPQDVAAGLHERTQTSPRLIDAAAATVCRDKLEIAQTALVGLESDELVLTRTGKTALPMLKSRIAETRAMFDAPEFGAKPQDRQAAVAALFRLHELIERMETRIIEDTQSVLTYGGELRRRLLVVLALCFAVAGLAIALGLSLVRRWVLRPVQELRTAAARFGAGELTYRVPLPANADQGDELVQLSGEVNHMAGMVKAMQDERVDRERLAAVGEMVRRLAHNLRNPLGGIRGLAELSRSEIESVGARSAEIRENQDRIIATVDRFEHWLTDLLSVTRPTTVELAPAQVRSWLAGLVEAHRAAAQTHGVDLSLGMNAGPERAVFDPRHLEHAVSAILSNAIDASRPRTGANGSTPPPPAPGGRRASVTVESLVSRGENGQTWEIRITDTGPGVSPDLREKIFTPYFTTKRDGNGIGLAVALQVVKAHRGVIDVLSPAGARENHPAGSVGACFVIRIPLDPAAFGVQGSTEVARIGQSGAAGGQDSRHRR